MTTLNLIEHNREAWDKIAQSGCPWSIPVSDEDVARAKKGDRNELNIRIEQGDMSDLSRFSDASFDIIFDPVSNPYVADIHAVWRECSRVLQQGGHLIAGSINPLNYLFEENDGDTVMQIRFCKIEYPVNG